VRLDWKPEIRGLHEIGSANSVDLLGESLLALPIPDVLDGRVAVHDIEALVRKWKIAAVRNNLLAKPIRRVGWIQVAER
jgi:hypothetical protein